MLRNCVDQNTKVKIVIFFLIFVHSYPPTSMIKVAEARIETQKIQFQHDRDQRGDKPPRNAIIGRSPEQGEQ